MNPGQPASRKPQQAACDSCGLASHRAHDYHALIRRWRNVARVSGWRMREYAQSDGYKAYFLQSAALETRGGIYISAGIHGDEPASTEGLVAWAERHSTSLAGLPAIVFPCLNPWGLVRNARHDASGRDLNRVWDSPTSPLVSKALERIRDHSFDLALTLHEDYDGQGFYIYEPARSRPYWGERLVASAAGILPPDPRRTIDGRRARGGVIRPGMRTIPRDAQPEAVYLHLHHARRTFTFETPSEYSLDLRVNTQVRLTESAIRLRSCGA